MEKKRSNKFSMNYLLICLATVMVSLQFFFNKRYQQQEGMSMEKTLVFSVGTSLVIGIVMLMVSGFRLEFSWFSLMTAGLSAVIGILFIYYSVILMEKVNLSLYSLVTMLGGMLLPFIGGICFWGEGVTIKKIISLAVITGALFIGIDLKADRKALVYCLFIFVLNGLNGVVSKWHQTYSAINVSSEGFLLLRSGVTILICVIILCFVNKNKLRLNHVRDALVNMSGFGLMSGLANLLVLIALVHVAASIQYPMITGGTIIVSTLVSLCTKEKITYINLLSTALAMGGTLLLL